MTAAPGRASALARLALSFPRRARLGLEVLLSYARARRAVRAGPLPAALAVIRDAPRERRGASRAMPGEPERLARATARVLRTLPTDTRCLMQSLTLSTLLARRGQDSTLVIGVRAEETFGAHAWVEIDGRPLLPPGGETFQRLVAL
jgi:hypothetical protein